MNNNCELIEGKLGVGAKIFLFIVLIVLFEGGLIKWLSVPSSLLLLSRDFLSLILILLAVNKSAYSKMKKVSSIAVVWSFFIVCYGLIQSIFNQSLPILYLIGLRFNVLYLWAAIAAACLINDYEFKYIVRVVVLIGIALCPLVIAQSFLPPSHVLNMQPDTEVEDIFKSAGDYVRTSGTFTFTLGFTCFLSLFTPFVFAEKWKGMNLFSNKFYNYLSMLCVLLMTMVSGSRGAIAWFSIIFMFYFFSELLSTKKISGRNMLILILIVSSIFVGLFYLEGQLDAMQTRFVDANDHEVLSERIWTIFFGEPHVIKVFSFFGYGLGSGTNAAAVIMGGVRDFALAESEPGRNLLELGFAGFLYIFLKWVISFYFIIKSIKHLLISNDVLPLLLWLSTAYAFLSWAVSGQLSANAIGYILLSFSLASLPNDELNENSVDKKNL